MTAIEANPDNAPLSARENPATEELASALEPDEPTADTPVTEVREALAPKEDEPSADAEAAGADAAGARPDRKKLEEQLEALKRREFELRRALLMADHPELVDAVRVLEGRVYAVSRAEAKLKQGLSKSEARRREVVEKKLTSLRDKRAELDAQIAVLDTELHALGADRAQVAEGERREALQELLVTLNEHEPAFETAGIEPSSLVPELGRWLSEVRALAETLVANRTDC